MTADLHIHTTASDGRLTPQEVVAEAVQAGLSYISINDHDTCAGYQSLSALSYPSGLTVLPGIEFSADVPGHELHILGYCVNPEHDELARQLQVLHRDRISRVERMVEKLGNLGYPIAYERIAAIAGGAKSIGRPHVAQAMVEKGYFPSVAAVFSQLLHTNGPAYVPHYRLMPLDIIRIIRTAGGTPILAHPGLVRSDALVRELITAGIAGLEAYHPEHTDEETHKYCHLAVSNRLLITGGSDFHGIPGRYPERLGLFTVPADLARALLI